MIDEATKLGDYRLNKIQVTKEDHALPPNMLSTTQERSLYI